MAPRATENTSLKMFKSLVASDDNVDGAVDGTVDDELFWVGELADADVDELVYTSWAYDGGAVDAVPVEVVLVFVVGVAAPNGTFSR